MQDNTYDVAIIGTGPAGMFAALELVDRKPGIRVAMFEKGTNGVRQGLFVFLFVSKEQGCTIL